jgi:nitrite transporter NirC
MTIFSVALLGNHPASVSLEGMFYNLGWVTLGNAIAGVFFMAGAYWRVNGQARAGSTAPMAATYPAAAE